MCAEGLCQRLQGDKAWCQWVLGRLISRFIWQPSLYPSKTRTEAPSAHSEALTRNVSSSLVGHGATQLWAGHAQYFSTVIALGISKSWRKAMTTLVNSTLRLIWCSRIHFYLAFVSQLCPYVQNLSFKSSFMYDIAFSFHLILVFSSSFWVPNFCYFVFHIEALSTSESTMNNVVICWSCY